MSGSDAKAHIASDLLFYTGPDGRLSIRVLVRDETVWLSQRVLSELFAVGVPAITKHLKNIFESGELDPGATVSKMEIVQVEGIRTVTRLVDMYSLDAVIAVGYRVNSYQATQFRRSYRGTEPGGAQYVAPSPPQRIRQMQRTPLTQRIAWRDAA